MADPLAPKAPAQSEAIMTQIILPSDANALNTAFGGKVMEWIDECAAIAAQRHCRRTVVTASMDDLHFHAAVKLGWVVTLRARVLATFKTSLEVGVLVEGENPLTGDKQLTTTALLTFVALNADGTKAAVPPLLLETEFEKRAAADAEARRQHRIARKSEATEWHRMIELAGQRKG
jgi:acyl-CoA hydrolase